MQVGQEGVGLVPRERFAERRHHAASSIDGLQDEAIVGRQTARQRLPAEEISETGALFAARRIGFVAGTAVTIKNRATGGLLTVQAEFGVRLDRGITAAGRHERADGEPAKQQEKPVARHDLSSGPI